MERYDVLASAAHGATFLLNAPYPVDQVWDKLPREVQQQIIDKRLKVYTIDAAEVAKANGMGRRINTIMQTCFFAISGVLPRDAAIKKIKSAIEKTYGRKSKELVEANFAAVDATLAHLNELTIPAEATAIRCRPPVVPEGTTDFVKRVTAVMLANKGDLLPVSAFPPDGTWPTGTAWVEKRNLALEIPVWDEKICIQCNKCAMVCPHTAIRAKVADKAALADAPSTFKSMNYKGNEFPGAAYLLQVAPEDCTGCGLCVEVCPAKDKANPRHKALDMVPQEPLRAQEAENFDFFLKLPEADRVKVPLTLKHTQLLQPLFEFSGACSGCGETPYIKLLTQLFGDRMVMANATGCSSIYGGNLPTTPYTTNAEGRGPAWANSLFEDNAEFGFGMRLALDKHVDQALRLLMNLASQLGDELVGGLMAGAQARDEQGVREQRARVEALRTHLASIQGPEARRLELLSDYLVRKTVWIVGGDGWAYDIGYGGLDHVMAMGRDVNILVLDTEVYSNTGGQQSKATPTGAAAKFAVTGRSLGKKDLGLFAMAYEHVYVAQVAFGAKDAQTVNAILEAEAYPGPSIVIAYSPCIAHGYDMVHSLKQQKLAMDSGHWPLYRYDPRRLDKGEAPLELDSAAPKLPLADYMRNEARFRIVERQDPERYKTLVQSAEKNARLRYDLLQHMAAFKEPEKGEQAAD